VLIFFVGTIKVSSFDREAAELDVCIHSVLELIGIEVE